MQQYGNNINKENNWNNLSSPHIRMFAKNKNKFKREDFVFQNGWFENVVKLPGSLHMEQFQISDCEECQILVLDSNAGVYVDRSKYCTIFIGPSQSSIFIRDCHYLNIVCLTQQFRVRDSTHCNIWLWCESRPIIQSSHHIVFSCFPTGIGYPTLLSQMKQAKLKLWNNNWFDIYDFTPNKFSMENHHCVQEIKPFHHTFSTITTKLTQSSIKLEQYMIPNCVGTSQALGKYDVVLIHPVPEKGVGLPVLQSRTAKMVENLKHLSRGVQENAMWLFVKIQSDWKDRWTRLSKNAGWVLQIVTDEKLKQSLESTVFVPFADER